MSARKSGKTTITKIAELSGVSYATVSRAFNSPEKVKPETLELIRKYSAEFNFNPRVIPNTLKAVSLIIPREKEVGFNDNMLISSIVSSLTDSGYSVVVSPMSGINALKGIFTRAFVAILHHNDEEMIRFIREKSQNTPVAVISDSLVDIGEKAITVCSDHRQGSSMAIEYLYAKGHRKIGYIGSPAVSRGYKARFEGYKNLTEAKSIFNENYVFLNSDELLMEGLRRMCAYGITALFIPQIEHTLKAMYYLNILGKKVPEDISVVACETQKGLEFLYPPLTCIVQPVARLGKRAAELIQGQVGAAHDECAVPREFIPYGFIERESVKNLIY